MDKKYQIQNIRDKKFQERKAEANRIYSEMLKLKAEISARWGYQRMMEIVSSDLRMRMSRQNMLLSNAVLKGEPEEMIKQTEAMKRGLNALNDYVASQGFQELDPDIWITKHPKTGIQVVIALSADALEKCAAICQAEKPSLYFSINEIYPMIDEEIFDIKKRFDGKFGNVEILDRKVIDIDKESKGFLEDELL
jgi:hypothetical protein